MEKKEKIFANGMSFKKRRDTAPEWIRAHISFKVDDFIDFLTQYEDNGWVNVDLKESKSGNYYCELNQWKRPEGHQKPLGGQTEEGVIDYSL